jgi:hypothetical protein
MPDHFSVKHSVPVFALLIKNMLGCFTFGVFLVVMAAHISISQNKVLMVNL